MTSQFMGQCAQEEGSWVQNETGPSFRDDISPTSRVNNLGLYYIIFRLSLKKFKSYTYKNFNVSELHPCSVGSMQKTCREAIFLLGEELGQNFTRNYKPIHCNLRVYVCLSDHTRLNDLPQSQIEELGRTTGMILVWS